jgi:predicted RNA-binding protein with PIN domain
MQTPAEAVVIVDARNVIRSRWPNLREDWFIDRVRAWAERERLRALVVFDGRAPGGILGEAELDERTTIVGTGGRIADDWIAEQAPALAAEGRRLWLVSSDRGLRERVASHVERTIGGGSFAGSLEQLQTE